LPSRPAAVSLAWIAGAPLRHHRERGPRRTVAVCLAAGLGARGGNCAQLEVRTLPAAVPAAPVGGWRFWPADVMLGLARFFLALLAVGPVVNVFTAAGIGRGRHEHTADSGAVLPAGATAVTKPAGPVPAHGAGLRR